MPVFEFLHGNHFFRAAATESKSQIRGQRFVKDTVERTFEEKVSIHNNRFYKDEWPDFALDTTVISTLIRSCIELCYIDCAICLLQCYKIISVTFCYFH